MHLLSNVLLSVIVAAQSLYAQHSTGGISAVPIAPPSPTTISESASFSESRNILKNAVFGKFHNHFKSIVALFDVVH